MGQPPWSARDPLVPLFLSGLPRLCSFDWSPSSRRGSPGGDGGVARRPGGLPHFSGVALLLEGLQQFLALLSLLEGMALCKTGLSLRYAVRHPPVRRASERFHAFSCPGAESFVGNSAWYEVLRESGNLLICNVEVVVETRNSETLLPPDFCQRHP